MTVIACAIVEGRAVMASDSSVSGDDVVALSNDKIFRSGETLVGVCGSLRFNDIAHRYRKYWCLDGAPSPLDKLRKLAAKLRKEFVPKDDESFEYIVCTTRALYLIDTTYAVIELSTSYHAIGSGALGALAVLRHQYNVGEMYSPDHAVCAVIPHHTDVKGPVRTIVVGGGALQEPCANRQKNSKKNGRKSSKRPASAT